MTDVYRKFVHTRTQAEYARASQPEKPNEKSSTFRTRAAGVGKTVSGTQCEAAESGVIHPGKIAAEVFGRTLNFGVLFAYCFRRFGYPNTGSDADKSIASYDVITPIDGLFLSIIIKPISDPELLFGYVMTLDLRTILLAEKTARNKKWHSRFKKWRIAKGVLLARDRPGYAKQESVNDVLQNINEFEDMARRYVREGNPQIDHVPVNTVMHRVNSAIKVTLEDLKIPVCTRDVLFSACNSDVQLQAGASDEELGGDEKRFVDSHVSSGNYVPPWYFDRSERFPQITESLLKMGSGSLEKGLDMLRSHATGH